MKHLMVQLGRIHPLARMATVALFQVLKLLSGGLERRVEQLLLVILKLGRWSLVVRHERHRSEALSRANKR